MHGFQLMACYIEQFLKRTIDNPHLVAPLFHGLPTVFNELFQPGQPCSRPLEAVRILIQETPSFLHDGLRCVYVPPSYMRGTPRSGFTIQGGFPLEIPPLRVAQPARLRAGQRPAPPGQPA
jgi:hypothetical protein